MANAEPELNVLALNSGSSSLKFGLYRAGSSRIELLLSGEAESIGYKSGKCHAEDSHGNVLLAETAPIPGQREAIVRIARLLIDSKMPAPDAISRRRMRISRPALRWTGNFASLPRVTPTLSRSGT